MGGRSSKRTLVSVVVLAASAAVIGGILWLRPGGFTPRPASIAALLQPAPAAVAPGVYLLGKCAPAAVYLVETAEGLVLIDSGLEADAKPVLEQIAELRFDVKQLKAIFLTHVHADHSLGAAHLRTLTGAKVYAGRADSEALRKGEPRERFFSTFHMPQLGTHATTVDVELEGEEVITLGDARFRVIGAAGHTPGSICYLLEQPGLRALFTGDVVQNLSNPDDGQLGTYAAHLAPIYGGNVRDYLTTLRRLRALPLPDLILPGHPRMDAVPQSPRLTETQWRRLLDTGIREMELLQARYDADGAHFLDGTPCEPLPGLHYFGNLEGWAVYCLKTPDHVIVVNAPGGAALVDLLRERFAKLGWQDRKISAVCLTCADQPATAGLAALVRQHDCQVAVSKAGLEAVRRLCPPQTKLLTHEEFEKSGWLEVRTITLAGRGVAPLAYQLRWAKKTVLLSGPIPVKPSGAALEELRRDLAASGLRADYVRSLNALGGATPDVWLPAVPIDGQNAHLYDFDWSKILNQNRQLASW